MWWRNVTLIFAIVFLAIGIAGFGVTEREADVATTRTGERGRI